MKIIGYPTFTPPDRDSLYRRSKQLLPLANKAVEMTIEKDEKTAIKSALIRVGWLNIESLL